MILAVHSDASYLSKASARSRVGGHFFCSKDSENPRNNGAIHNVSKILKAIMSSTAEAELGALYVNACEAVPMRQLLEEMGHKQPKLPSRLTTAPHSGSSPTSNHVVQRPWTCVSISYAAANRKTNSGTSGNLEPTTKPTTGPSIIAQLTTLKSARKFSPQNSYSMPYEHQLTKHQQLWAKVLSKQQMLPSLRDPT
jgi:hypothetical protein